MQFSNDIILQEVASFWRENYSTNISISNWLIFCDGLWTKYKIGTYFIL